MDRLTRLAIVAAAVPMLAGQAAAGEARVENVRVTADRNGAFRFDVTVSHADEGWEHYANAFTVTAPDGAVLGRRELLHPHVEEQPFTRSLGGVVVPEGLATVSIRATDLVHGDGPAVTVALPR